MPPGSLSFDETAESIGPSTTAAQAQSLRIFARARLHLRGGQARLFLDRCLIKACPFNATLHFEGPRLARIDLFLLQAADGKSWAEWTRESELARKAAHESWAESVFGQPLTIKPYLMPEPVFPFNPGLDHPRHALFDWGEVTSYYDDRSGAAGLAIDYLTPPSPPPSAASPS